MNKVYKVVWNATLSTWIAVSETAKSKSKSKSKSTNIKKTRIQVAKVFFLTTLYMALHSQILHAAPTISGDNQSFSIGSATATDSKGTCFAIGGSGSFGASAICSGVDSMAIGNGARASGQAAEAIGISAIASGAFSNSIGTGSQSTADRSIAIGKSAVSSGDNSIAIGSGSSNSSAGSLASGLNSTSIGMGASAIGVGSSAYGTTSYASGGNSIAIGQAAKATNTVTSSLGSGANSSGYGATALGNDTTASGKNALAVAGGNGDGTTAVASGDGSNAVGYLAKATGLNSTALGTSTLASKEKAIAVGFEADATGIYATAVGNNTVANIDAASSFGSGAQATGKASTAIGNDTLATGSNSVAVGAGNSTNQSGLGAKASGASSSALGYQSAATGANSTALGTNSSATVADGVALGSGSVASVASGVKGYDPLTNATTTSNTTTWQSNTGAVAVGNGTTTTRQITGLAAGTADTDAVNIAQLKNAQTYSSNVANGTKTVLGGSATVGTDGTVSTSNIGGTGSNTVDGAISSVKSSTATAQTAANNAQATADKGLNFSANNGTADNVKLGEAVNFNNGTNTTATYDASSNTYKYSIVDAPTFAGLVTSNGVNASNQKVTGVAAGTIGSSSTDAVNGAQINTISNSTKTLLGGNATVASDGTVSTTNIGGTGASTVDGAVSSLKDQATKAKTTVSSGLNTVVTPTTNSDGSTNYKVETAKDLVVDSVKAGNTTLNNAGVAVDDGTGNVSKLTTAGTTVADSAGNNASYGAKEASLKDSAGNTNTSTATGNTVADTTGNSTATTAAGNTVKDSSGNSSVYGASGSTLTDKAGNTTVVDTKGLSFKDTTGAVTGPSITASGVNAGGKAVSNVGDAVNSTDAVNKKLLDEATSAGSAKTDASGNSTASALGGGSTYDPTTGTVSAPTYSVNGSSKNNVGDAISALDQGFTVTSNGTNGKAIKAGDTLEIGTADGEKNLTVSKDGNSIKYGLNRDLDLDSVKAGNTTLNNAGVAVDDGTGNVSKLTTAGTTVADSAGNNASYGAKEASLKDSAGNTNTSTATGNTVADTTGNSTATTAAGNTVKDSSGNSSVYGASGSTLTDKAGNTTVVDTKGLSFKDTTGAVTGPSITASGVNAGGKAVSNVGDAVNSTDAVNKKLLDEATSAGSAKTDASGNSTASALGGGSTYDPTTGTVSAPTYSVNGSSKNNVGDAISALDQGFTVTSNGANGKAIKAGDTLEIGTADGEKNLTVSKDGNSIKYGLNRNLDLDSVKAGNTTLNNAGVAVDDGTGNVSKLTTAGTTVADSAGNNASYGAKEASLKDSAGNTNTSTATGNTVADTTGNSTATTAAGNTVKDSSGNSSVYGASGSTLTDKAGNTTVVDTKGLSFKDTTGAVTGPSITASGVNAGGKAVSNVGDAVNSTDAVNKKLLDEATSAGSAKTDASGNSTASALGGGSTYDPTTGTVSAPTYSVNGSSKNNVGDAISALDQGFTVTSNGANGKAIKAGDTLEIGTADGEKNLTVSKDGNSIKYGLNRNLDLDSVKAGNTTLNNAGVAVDDGTGNVSKLTTAGTTVADSAGNNASYGAKEASLKDSAGNTNTSTATGNTVADTTGNSTATTAAGNTVKDSSGNSSVYGASGSTLTDKAGNTTVVDTKGLSFKDTTGAVTGPSITASGVNAGGKAVSNVGDAVNSTDAVNKKLLDEATSAGSAKTDASGNSTASALGGGSTYDPTTGTVSAPTYSVNGSSKNNVGDAISALDQGFTVTSNGANGKAIKAGDTLEIGTADGEKNLTVSKDGNSIKYGLNRNLDLDSVKAGNTTLNNAGVAVDDGTGNVSKLTTAGTTVADSAGNNASYGAKEASLKDSAGNTNTSAATGNTVADSAGNSTATTAAGNTVKDSSGNSSVYGASGSTLTDKAGDTTVVDTKGLSFKDTTGAVTGPSITASGVNAGGKAVSNVGDAVNSTDAVNKKLLDEATSAGGAKTDASGNSTASALGGGSTYDPTTGTVSAPTYSVNGSSKNNVGDAISALDQGFTVTSNGANGKAIKAGDTLEIGTADGEKNLTVSKDGNSIKYGLNRNLDLDSVKAGNTTLNNAGVAVDDGTGNVSKLTTAGTTVADSAGNNASYGAKEASLKDSAGNTNTSTATGNTVADSAGNSTATTAAGTNVADKNGNSNSLTATGNTLADKDGNNTVTTASGTNVTDKDGNSNNLTATGNTLKDNAGNNTTSTASGVTVADGSGNSTAVTATGVSVSGGPSLTKTGLDLAGGTLTNLKGGDITAGSTDAVTGGQVAEVQSQLQKQLGSVGDSAVQYAKNSDGTINYASIVAGNGNTTATIENGKVTSGGTTISNLANGVNASDAVNKGQLDTLSTSLSSSLTSVVAGNGQTFNLTDQIVNRNIDSSNENSSFKTYDKMGQTMTDEATLAQTVKKMNMDGIKYSHTNGDTTRVNGLTNDSSAGGVYSTAIGINAIINENARNAVALGVNTSAGTDAANSVVIGNNSSVSGTSSVAIGDGATASGTQSISIGTGNTVSGNHSGAFGDPSTITGNESYVLGNNNTVSTDNTFVVGNNVTQTTAGSVVLGTGSAARTAGGVAGFAPAKASTTDASAIAATASTTGAVAVGDAMNNVYRQVTGVAAGTANSDAVNVAQLKSVDNKVDTSTASIATALGGGATVNSDGSISNPTYTVGGTTSTTLAGALSALDAAVKNANTSGKDVNVTSVTAGNTALDTNGVSTKDNAGNSSQLAANGLTVSNANTGNSAQYGADNATYTAKNGSSTSIGTNGLNFKDSSGNATGPSVTASGINAGGQTITNVANGVNSSDAVNKGQLDSAVSGVTSSVSQLANSAVQYDTKADGSVNKDKITLGGSNGTTITNVADGVIASGSKDAVNGGQLANVQSQVTANTNNISSLQNTVSSIGSGKTGIVQQASNDAAINIGKDSAGTQVNVANSSGTSRTVSGVASGKVSSSSTDAVNGAQVYNVSAATAAALGGGSAVQADGTVSQPSYSVGGSSYNNVGGAISAVDTRVGNLESAFAQTNQQMNKLRNDTNAGIAGAIAIASLGQPIEKGASALSLGTGVWNNSTNLAVGASGVTEDHKIFGKPVNYIWKMAGTSDFKGNSGGGGSVTVTWK